MYIYLPIAELSVNALVILLLGAGTGILAGLFGVGGGFLLTPLLIFMGISPSVAVASAANQIIAASLSGFRSHWRRGNVDVLMGGFLTSGSLLGAGLGVWLFTWLKTLGQIDLVISLCYVLFLGGIGGLMAAESVTAIRQKKQGYKPETKPVSQWQASWPWQVEFVKSGIRMTAWLPLLIGVGVGILVSLMGIGGGFVLIPAMIYLLRMPTSVVIGTSLMQIIITTCVVTVLHAVNTQTVDIVLALLLLVGSVTGAQMGTRMGLKLAPEYLRGSLALLVLLVALKLGFGLFVTPDALYTVQVGSK